MSIFLRLLSVFLFSSLLAGCMGVTSGGKIEADRVAYQVPIGAPPEVVGNWKLAGLTVTVPKSLSVSQNPDIQFPRERIVWWGEPEGDRRAQVQKIVTDAVLLGTSGLNGRVPVNVAVDVKLFHAVTPMARNGTYFAWHDIQFSIKITDAASGAILAFDPDIDADIEALRGITAQEAEARGDTQKVRISRRIAQVVQSWLGSGAAAASAPPAAALTATTALPTTKPAAVAPPPRPAGQSQTETSSASTGSTFQGATAPPPQVNPVLDVACGYDPNGQRCIASKIAAGQ